MTVTIQLYIICYRTSTANTTDYAEKLHKIKRETFYDNYPNNNGHFDACSVTNCPKRKLTATDLVLPTSHSKN